MTLPVAPLQSVPLFIVALLVGGLLVGLASLGAGVLSLWRWRVLSADEANQYRAGLDGPMEVEGPASPTEDGGPFSAAVSHTACLVCEIEAQKYESGQHGGSWTTVESRTTARPFVVESPLGAIRVEPEGANLVLDWEVVDELGRTDEATGDTKAFLDAVGIERRSGSLDLGVTEVGYGSKYRVREARVDVNEDVYAAGWATTDDQTLGGYGGPDAVVRTRQDRSLRDRFLAFHSSSVTAASEPCGDTSCGADSSSARSDWLPPVASPGWHSPSKTAVPSAAAGFHVPVSRSQTPDSLIRPVFDRVRKP